jgi:ribonuclease G
MSKELVVSSNRHETRVAILEDDQLVEIYYQRQQEYSLAGSIHKGRVTRVLPGMQSAFVDIGLERDAFLYVSDFFEDNEEYEQVVSSVEDQVLRLEKGQAPVRAMVAEPDSAVKTEAPRVILEQVAAGGAPVPGADRPAGAAPGPERDGRDRRGRRPRRRRGRGRGFPESKYASPTAPVEIKPAAGELSEAVELEEEELPVLPGESISKYSQPEPEFESSEEPEAIEPESERLPEFAAELAPEPALPEPAVAVAEPESAAVSEAEPVVGVAEPVTDVEQVSDLEEESAPEESGDAGQVGDLPHDLSNQALGATNGDAPEEADMEEAPAEAVEPARIPTSLTAALREQGGRYPHRVSRRMRRKMRGGEGRPEGPQENRGAETKGAETKEVRAEPQPAPRQERSERPAQPSISDLLKEGQEIIVQIAKEPLGQKGARITSYVALPGRYVVYMPTVDHVGVSRKIASDEERQRLKRILQSNRAGIPGGFILRTAGEGKSEEDLRADMHFLYNLWMDMRQKAEKRKAPALIHHDLDLVQRILRDQLTSSFKNVWVDNEEMYADVMGFVQRFQPGLVGRVKLYTRPTPIFDAFNITAELEKALRPKVWLKTGGYIVINQTEALVAIDINTGKYVGKSNRLEDTIVKTNTDAVKEIVRQIRLRDLGGIIVVDFIDMDERKNRQKVMQALEEAMRADRAPNKILAFNDFGLVAITRKRVKQSLERTLCAPCPYCEGAGYVKSVTTVIGEILQEAIKVARALEGRDVVLRVNPEVAKVLKSHNNDFLQELEEILGRTVMVKSDPLLHQEKFDLA